MKKTLGFILAAAAGWWLILPAAGAAQAQPEVKAKLVIVNYQGAAGLGNSNPFIGAWELDSVRDKNGKIIDFGFQIIKTFTETEVETKTTGQILEKEDVNIRPVEYRRIEDQPVATLSEDVLNAKFRDKDTFEALSLGDVTVVYKRINGASKPPKQAKDDSKPPKQTQSKPPQQAQGNSNPLLGTWYILPSGTVETLGMAGISFEDIKREYPTFPTLTFTASEAIRKEGADEERWKIKYRQDGRNIWSFSGDGNDWEGVIIVDGDTLESEERNPESGESLIYKRVR